MRRFRLRILVVNRQANLDLERHAVAHAAFLTFLLIVLVLEADRLAAVVAKLRTNGVKGAALVTKRFAGGKRIDLDRRTAVLTVCAQVIQTFEMSALALPVSDLILDKIERRRLAKIRDRKDRLERPPADRCSRAPPAADPSAENGCRIRAESRSDSGSAPQSRSWKNRRVRAPDLCVFPIPY